jgi:lipoate---protein ligase
MKWRLIELDTYDAYMNMAIDQAIMESVAKREAHPTIRFYRWKPSAVSIGRFQSMIDEVNIEKCKELGVDCVRRLTGGGAVYHDNAGEITYSVIAPESALPKGIRESYKTICDWIVIGLGDLGIRASFVPINDIVVGSKKISGNAQTRENGVVLQHGTVLYDLNLKTMFSLLNVSKEKISDKMIKSAEERVTRVLDYTNASQAEFYKALLHGFTIGKEYSVGQLTADEAKHAAYYAKNRYSTPAWNFSR